MQSRSEDLWPHRGIPSLCHHFDFISSRVIASIALDRENGNEEQLCFEVFLVSDVSAPTGETFGSSNNVIHACSLFFPLLSKEIYDIDIGSSFCSLNTPTGLLFATLPYLDPRNDRRDNMGNNVYAEEDGYEDGYGINKGYRIITSSISVLGHAARHAKEGFRSLSWQEWGPESSKIFIENLDVDDKIHNS